MGKSVVMMAAALILAVGCNDDLRTETPVIELSEVTGNQINVSSDGGLVEVEYTIVNPVEGGHVSAKADADWLGEPDCSVDGVIMMDVPAPMSERQTAAPW